MADNNSNTTCECEYTECGEVVDENNNIDEGEDVLQLEENQQMSIQKLGGYDFFNRVLNKTQYVLAPMVDQSELAFRLLCRRHGTQLCYTPMFNSKIFANDKNYRKRHWDSCPEDRPLVVQFCANEPEWLLKAARYVENNCDAVDINLGCPQRIAKRGNYGAFLMDNPELVHSLVRTLHENLRVPVFCKIRIFKDFDRTLQFAKMLESAGCQLLTVHGRTREMKGQFTGLADWDYIRRIKEQLSIPVIANGNIRHFQDVMDCLAYTKADGVMSAEGLLRNPALFSGKEVEPFSLVYEYLDICQAHPKSQYTWAKDHVCKILDHVIEDRHKARERLLRSRNWEELRRRVKEFESLVREGKIDEYEREPAVKENWSGDALEIFGTGFFVE